MTKIARHVKAALELIHAMIYFAPEADQHYTALGLEKGRMGYYASRSAAMGPVGPGVVAATFYNFNPESVAQHIPAAWKIATPEKILEARLNAVDDAMRRMLDPELLASEEVAQAAELAREATAGCSPEGKPLYAAHADLDWPEAPHLRLWHGVTLLREFRGDAHIAALQHAEISGIAALVLHSTVPGGFTADAARILREWSQSQWAQASEQLRERGLIDAEGEITKAGEALREEVEVATDVMSMGPWQTLRHEQIQELVSSGGEVSKALYKAGAVPTDLFR